MTQVIKTESPDSSGTNAVLMVLLVAALVAFGVWFFSQGNFTPAANQGSGINVDVQLPAGNTGGNLEGGANTGGNTGQ
jgi:hypothetical protein